MLVKSEEVATSSDRVVEPQVDRIASPKAQWAAIKPPPCEVDSLGRPSQCPKFTQCRNFNLACKEFRSYLPRGRSLRSPDPQPSRKIFERIFSGRD